jgi:hypothetical protein
MFRPDSVEVWCGTQVPGRAQDEAAKAAGVEKDKVKIHSHMIGGGFGREGLAERQGRRVVYARNLIETLRRRELDAVGDKLAAETGLPFNRAGTGEYVAGICRKRLVLASGRFVMLDDALGFQLVPWSPSLERQLGKHVSGVARDDGGVDWSFGRKRGLGL